MNKNSIKEVSEEDYEIYKIRMPFLLNKNKRNSYINQQLEKEHPCFSNNCCYDVKYKFEKGNLVAKIAVMDKVRLVQYKKLLKKNKITLGNENKKYFIDKKQDFFLKISSVCFVVVIVTAAFGILKNIQANINKKKKCVTVVEKILERSEPQIQIEEFCQKLFTNIKDCNGKIIKFNYKQNFSNADENISSVNIKISNCFPEKIMDSKLRELTTQNEMNISSVEYENKIPVFTIDFTSKNAALSNEDENQVDKTKIIPSVRNAILSTNGNISIEDNDKNEIDFCIKRKNLCNIIEKIKTENNDYEYEVSEVSVEKNNEELFFKVKFNSNKSQIKKSILQIISDYEDLFLLNKKNTLTSVQTKKNIPEPNSEFKEVVGRITTADGRKIVFFKSEDGKIKEVKE